MSALARVLLLLGLLPLALGACGQRVAGAGDRVLRGRLVDDETGQPVSRESVYLHAFRDGAGQQVSLEPARSSTYALRVGGPDVRLRVSAGAGEYHLYEETLVVPPEGLEHEVRLVPTHWVRLHGRVLWQDGARWRPPSEGDGNLSKVRIDIDGVGGLRIAQDGTYSRRVPRTLLRFATVNTDRWIEPTELELTGFEGDERRLDLHLVER